MDHGVLYLLDGTKLAARLVVSLYSLRKHYSGDVTIVVADRSAAQLCRHITGDRGLQVNCISLRPPAEIVSHRGYLLKSIVHRLSPYTVSAFLDCDTLVRGPIDELFELPTEEHILVTQFCNWKTAHGVIARRIRAWNDLFPELVQPALNFGRAVNTGVFSFTPRTKIVEPCHAVAVTGQERFIPDEISMQLLLPHFPSVMLDSRFNCSAKFGDPAAPDTRIVHFHGRKHTGKYGGAWLATYCEVVKQNVADIRKWTPACDRQLKAYLTSRQDA